MKAMESAKEHVGSSKHMAAQKGGINEKELIAIHAAIRLELIIWSNVLEENYRNFFEGVVEDVMKNHSNQKLQWLASFSGGIDCVGIKVLKNGTKITCHLRSLKGLK